MEPTTTSDRQQKATVLHSLRSDDIKVEFGVNTKDIPTVLRKKTDADDKEAAVDSHKDMK